MWFSAPPSRLVQLNFSCLTRIAFIPVDTGGLLRSWRSLGKWARVSIIVNTILDGHIDAGIGKEYLYVLCKATFKRTLLMGDMISETSNPIPRPPKQCVAPKIGIQKQNCIGKRCI